MDALRSRVDHLDVGNGNRIADPLAGGCEQIVDSPAMIIDYEVVEPTLCSVGSDDRHIRNDRGAHELGNARFTDLQLVDGVEDSPKRNGQPSYGGIDTEYLVRAHHESTPVFEAYLQLADDPRFAVHAELFEIADPASGNGNTVPGKLSGASLHDTGKSARRMPNPQIARSSSLWTITGGLATEMGNFYSPFAFAVLRDRSVSA